MPIGSSRNNGIKSLVNIRGNDFRDFVKEEKTAVAIAQIIGSRIPLGIRHTAKCPFHEDRRPSFSVNQAGQYFYCFGCGVGGDVFKFWMLIDKKTSIEAPRTLVDDAEKCKSLERFTEGDI